MSETPRSPDDLGAAERIRLRLRQTAQVLALPLCTIAAVAGILWAFPVPQIPAVFRNHPSQGLHAATALRHVVAQSHNAVSASSKSSIGVRASQSPSTTPTAGATPTQHGVAPATATSSDSQAKLAAAAQTSAHTLVALGDSITYGFGLPGAVGSQPSPDAYPLLVANHEHWLVKDLGVTGWSSADLLNALATSKFKQALHTANLVTIDIGSNDLLQASYNLLSQNATVPPKNAVTTSALLKQALAGYTQRLPKIIAAVKAQTDAPIILVNLYDPFPDGSSLHDVAEQVIGAANQILWATAAENAIPVADAHALFNHQQATYVRLDNIDIHPTLQGQSALAALVEKTISSPLQSTPGLFAVSRSGALVYSQPQPGPFAIGWLHGNSGVLVVGTGGDGAAKNQLKVVMPSGHTGYVAKQAVSVLVRPFANVAFDSIDTKVGSGQLQPIVTRSVRTQGAGRATPTSTAGTLPQATTASAAFSYDGTVYVPVKWFGQLTAGTVNVDSADRIVSLNTPMHSGLVQTGWAEHKNSGGSVAGRRGADWQYVASPSGTEMTLNEAGWLLQVDGEAVDLAHPLLQVTGQLYAPAAQLWRYLGGRVTHETNGPLTLFPAGS